jgi:hypothetical protein
MVPRAALADARLVCALCREHAKLRREERPVERRPKLDWGGGSALSCGTSVSLTWPLADIEMASRNVRFRP